MSKKASARQKQRNPQVRQESRLFYVVCQLTKQKIGGETSDDLPPLKALSFLDRFLVIWIILAMAIGIILGNTVHSAGRRLQENTFVGVSFPIGMSLSGSRQNTAKPSEFSHRPPRHDVSYPLQSPLRNPPPTPP